MGGPRAPIQKISARAFVIPTDMPEADGTLSWDSTTVVVAEVSGAGRTGVGYTYSHSAAAVVIRDKLAEAITGLDAFDIPAAYAAMNHVLRNIGRPGIGMAALSAIDSALWDLKARLHDLPLAALLGKEREQVPVYGSGGFTSYSEEQLTSQLRSWVERDGCRWVKMKVGSEPDADVRRVEAARQAIGDAGLFVDANGAYRRKHALGFADSFAELGVSWFEEPVSSDDLDGLNLIRDRAPAGMAITAGEYGATPAYFRRMLEAGAVDVLQADATRCGGITGFLRVAALCEAFQIELSAHTAPSLHLHPACAAPAMWHVEWFHDHVRIEQMLFDGAARVEDGIIRPDLGRPGIGLKLKEEDAARYAA